VPVASLEAVERRGMRSRRRLCSVQVQANEDGKAKKIRLEAREIMPDRYVGDTMGSTTESVE
jgi:hypothetical protein